MKQTMLFVVLLLVVGVMSAGAVVDKYPTTSGNWNDGGIWNGNSVPAANDNVFIGNGTTVTVTTNATCANLTVGKSAGPRSGNGVLVINGGVTLTVTGNVSVGEFIPSGTNIDAVGTVQFQTAGSGLLDMTSATSTMTFANASSSFSGASVIRRAINGAGTKVFSSASTRVVTGAGQGPVTILVETYPGTQPLNQNGGVAIDRYYVITPSGALTADLRLAYLDSELNSIPEADLTLCRYNNGWGVPGVATVDQTNNWVELTGVDTWSDWAITNANNPLPIQLASFAGTALSNGHVQLNWMTASELNNYGFEVQRSAEATSGYETIPNSFIQGHGTTIEPRYYRYTDVTATAGARYYRLKQYDLDGTIHYTEGIFIDSPTGVGEETTPVAFEVSQNYPNPFNPSTSIKFALPERTHVILKVYNLLGKEVATLVNGDFAAGRHDVQWNASDVASGVYLYRIQAGNFVETRKLTLIK